MTVKVHLTALWAVTLAILAFLVLSHTHGSSARPLFKDQLGYRCKQTETDHAALCPDNPIYHR